MVQADLSTLYRNDLTIFRCTFTSREASAELVWLINAGAVRPLVSKTYLLIEIDAVQANFAAKIYPGTLVLIPPQGWSGAAGTSGRPQVR